MQCWEKSWQHPKNIMDCPLATLVSISCWIFFLGADAASGDVDTISIRTNNHWIDGSGNTPFGRYLSMLRYLSPFLGW